MEGWIKLHRKIIDWEWFDDINTFSVWTHILLNANYEDKRWHGIEIKRGQWLTSIDTIKQGFRKRNKFGERIGKSSISTMSIRTALNHLILTNEITIKTTPNYTLITVNNYDEYQEVTNGLTNDKQTTNKRLTTTKEYKNIRNKEDSNTPTLINLPKKEKPIKTKKTYTSENLTLEQVAERLANLFKEVTGKPSKIPPNVYNNLSYWLETYEPKEIAKAIQQIPFDDYWGKGGKADGAMTPTIFFRKKNKSGEDVDNIGSLLNSNKEEAWTK